MVFYFSPKAAGTSLRAFLFEVENGFPLRKYKVQGEQVSVTVLANQLVLNNRFKLVDHGSFGTAERIALVRDPVRRALSAYSNRVVHFSELSDSAVGPQLTQMGLPPDPDIDVFFANVLQYMTVSRSIARHFSHQDVFLGREVSYFDHVFTVERLGDLVDYVNRKCGTSARMPYLQDGGPKIEFATLKRETQRNILNFLRPSSVIDWVAAYRSSFDKYLAETALVS